MTITHPLDTFHGADRTAEIRRIAHEVVEASDRAAARVAVRIADREWCELDNFDAHVAGFGEDGAPEFGACTEGCLVFPML